MPCHAPNLSVQYALHLAKSHRLAVPHNSGSVRAQGKLLPFASNLSSPSPSPTLRPRPATKPPARFFAVASSRLIGAQGKPNPSHPEAPTRPTFQALSSRRQAQPFRPPTCPTFQALHNPHAPPICATEKPVKGISGSGDAIKSGNALGLLPQAMALALPWGKRLSRRPASLDLRFSKGPPNPFQDHSKIRYGLMFEAFWVSMKPAKMCIMSTDRFED